MNSVNTLPNRKSVYKTVEEVSSRCTEKKGNKSLRNAWF